MVNQKNKQIFSPRRGRVYNSIPALSCRREFRFPISKVCSSAICGVLDPGNATRRTFIPLIHATCIHRTFFPTADC